MKKFLVIILSLVIAFVAFAGISTAQTPDQMAAEILGEKLSEEKFHPNATVRTGPEFLADRISNLEKNLGKAPRQYEELNKKLFGDKKNPGGEIGDLRKALDSKASKTEVDDLRGKIEAKASTKDLSDLEKRIGEQRGKDLDGIAKKFIEQQTGIDSNTADIKKVSGSVSTIWIFVFILCILVTAVSASIFVVFRRMAREEEEAPEVAPAAPAGGAAGAPPDFPGDIR